MSYLMWNSTSAYCLFVRYSLHVLELLHKLSFSQKFHNTSDVQPLSHHHDANKWPYPLQNQHAGRYLEEGRKNVAKNSIVLEVVLVILRSQLIAKNLAVNTCIT